jgi:hypothetical protein
MSPFSAGRFALSLLLFPARPPAAWLSGRSSRIVQAIVSALEVSNPSVRGCLPQLRKPEMMRSRLEDFLSHCRVDNTTLAAQEVFQEGRVCIEQNAHPTCTRFTVDSRGVAENKRLLDTVSAICGASPTRTTACSSQVCTSRVASLNLCTAHLRVRLVPNA